MKRSGRKLTLGYLVATPGAQAIVGNPGSGTSLLGLFRRHADLDFGDLGEEDKAANMAALSGKGRVLSSYRLPNGTVWVVTDPGWKTTTAMLPGEC